MHVEKNCRETLSNWQRFEMILVEDLMKILAFMYYNILASITKLIMDCMDNEDRRLFLGT